MKILPRLITTLLLVTLSAVAEECRWSLPIKTDDRQSWQAVRLTSIGQFGRPRIGRPQVPAHLHTGVDLCRPSKNYAADPKSFLQAAWQ